jgi:hypothetical protein
MDISRVQFQSLRPMLRTKDLQATIEFYTWRLGFTCTASALDFGLLEDRTGERSIAHRIAVYLEELFREWHVDCEFNRQGDVGGRTTKRVSANETLPESREGQGSVDVTPDIIVHLRRTRRNLLAIEVKPSHSTELPKDREKLRRYLTESHLKYSFAVLVTYHNGRAEFAPIERVEAR